MFYPPTCVGLRYGRARACLGVFLGTSGSLASLSRFVRSLALRADRISLVRGPRSITGTSRTPPSHPPSVAPSVVAPRARCRNVCLLRVGYAYRPRLSPPTDPGRISLAQETSGSRRTSYSLVSRYSCQHSHSHALHRRSPSGFSAHGKLPYRF